MRMGGSRPFHRRSYRSCPLWRRFPTASLRPSPENTPRIVSSCSSGLSPTARCWVSSRSDAGWTPMGSPLKYRHDGWFASDQDPLKAFKVVDADLLGVPTQYILSRAPAGYGHYLNFGVFCQRVRRRPGNLSAAWRARLSSTWLVVNENPDELAWNGMDPRLRLATVPNLDGLIAVRPPTQGPAPPPTAGHIDAHIVDASASDTVATMMLIIPQLNGRDLDDLAFTTVANGKGSDVACLPAGNGLAYLTLFGDPGQTITVAVK